MGYKIGKGNHKPIIRYYEKGQTDQRGVENPCKLLFE